MKKLYWTPQVDVNEIISLNQLCSGSGFVPGGGGYREDGR